MYDVITIGGATLDIFLSVHEQTTKVAIKTIDAIDWFCIKKGEKIPVDGLHYDVGGNATNVAVGLARLGLRVATHIHYGDDEISQKIIHRLDEEHVATEYAVMDKGETSPISIILNFGGDRTLFAHHIKRQHVLPEIAIPKWIYLTSLGERWEDLYRQTIAFVKANNVKLAYNPGSHQLGSGESLLEQVSASYLLCINKEEGKLIAKDETDDVKTLLTHLQSLGPKIVSLTDGEHGSYVIDEQKVVHHMAAFPGVVLEKTGAGDAYATGFLAALVHGESAATAMQWGAMNAASVINGVGAEKGLLHKEAMAKKILEHVDFKANVLE